MKSLGTIVLAAVSIGATLAQDYVNCDLKTGGGCSTTSPYFSLQYTGDTPGSAFECRRNYKMTVSLTRRNNHFYCYFVTNDPDNNYIYTISHNAARHNDQNTPYIRTLGDNTRIVPKKASNHPYSRNYWYYNNFHKTNGQSWAYYKLRNKKMTLYSTNLEHFYKAGHPNFFEPRLKDTYIGLNRKFEDVTSRGKGLCQVYCKVGFKARRGRNKSSTGLRQAAGDNVGANNAADNAAADDELDGPPPPPPAIEP